MQICFALAFFVCRIALGPFVVYYTLQSAGSHPVVKVGLAPCLLCSPSSKHRQWRMTAPCSLTHVLVINQLPRYDTPNLRRQECPVQAGGLAIQIVSLFWFYKIVQVNPPSSPSPQLSMHESIALKWLLFNERKT